VNVKLRVKVEGDDHPDLSEFSYFLTADGRVGYADEPFAADRFTAEAVPADHYTLKLSGSLLKTRYAKSARAGNADVLADGLTVEGSGNIDIDIVLASDGAAVNGVVRDANGNPVPGATVVLAPDRRSRADLFKNTAADQNGHYEFGAITPGSYKLFAWRDVEPEAWYDPEFLRGYEEQGAKTALERNARATVDLKPAKRPEQR